MNVVMLRPSPAASRASSRCRARPRAWRSPAASSTRCSASPRSGSPRSSPAGARWWPCPPAPPAIVTRAAAPRLRLGQPGQGGRDRGDPRRRRRAAAATGRTCPTSSRTPTRWRATPGSRRWRSAPPPATPRSPTTPGSRSPRSAARPGVYAARYAGEDATYADNRAKLLARARRAPPTDAAALPHGRAGRAGPTGASSPSRASATGTIADRRAGRARLRLRPGVRARRRRRPHVRRDDRRREERHVAPRPGVPGTCCAALAAVASPAAQVDRPAVEDLVASIVIHAASCIAIVGSTWAGHDVHAVADGDAGACSPVTNVTCSSEQNHTSPPSIDGLPWSMPSAFSPTSATAQSAHTEITVPSTYSACPNGRPSVAYAVSISA